MIRFGVVGLDHRHVYEQTGRLLELGCECAGYFTKGEPEPLAGFRERFPDLARVDDADALHDDPDVRLIVTAGRSRASAPRSRSGRWRPARTS